ncbi:alcohol dehydrogenase catalytic domain-containing protein [Patulibacter sp. S7RM1-6]
MSAASTVAAVLDGPGSALHLEELRVDAPRAGEVAVRVRASGVCHSDLHVVQGDWPIDDPLVLGHEGAGVVEAVGPGVSGVAVGDRVMLSWFAPCRECTACAAGEAWLCRGTTALANTLPDGTSRLSRPDGGAVLPYLGLGTFSERVVAPVSAVVPAPDDVPFEVAALIGCAVTTGIGAVTNTAQVGAGRSGVVLGCGGVGLAIVMGLALVGADPIVAIDLSDERLEVARELGATVTLRGDDPDLAAHVAAATGDGPDFVFEAIGAGRTIETAIELVGQGGAAVLVGMPAAGTTATIDPFALADQGKRILGCNYGSSVPAVDFPRIARLYRTGRLPLERLLGDRRPLADAGAALSDLRAAVGLRTILVP